MGGSFWFCYTALQYTCHHSWGTAGVDRLCRFIFWYNVIALGICNFYDAIRCMVFAIIGDCRITCRHFYNSCSICKTTDTGWVIFIISFIESLEIQCFKILHTTAWPKVFVQTIGRYVTWLLYRSSQRNGTRIGVACIRYGIASCHTAVI